MKKLIGCLTMLVGLLVFAPCLPFSPAVSAATVSDQAIADRINVNAASAKELQTLPGIGRVTAQRIIDYRTTHGPFSTQEDLLKVKGVGQSTLLKISDRIILQ